MIYERFVEKRFLKTPIKEGNDKRRLTIYKNNVLEMEFLIELPLEGEEADFYSFIDIGYVLGESAIFKTELLLDGAYVNDEDNLLKEAVFSDVNFTENEVKRPKLHFTTNSGWLNDPNGMVFDGVKYHLYYQHNPVGRKWGNMCWGHATSMDMIFFKDHGDVMYQDEMGMMYSGSAFYDEQNMSGLGDESPPLLFYYTAAGGENPWSAEQNYTQCLAFSADKGRTFTKYEMNPVIEHITYKNRDPKIIKYDDAFIITLFLKDNDYMILRSLDLITWESVCQITLPGTSECPDFFPLEIDEKTYWVFWGANGGYCLGSFDGRHFIPETFSKMECGLSYAAQTYQNQPDNRRIMMHWIRREMPEDLPYNQAMSLPLELKLKITEDIVLCMLPIKEIAKLHKDEFISIVTNLLMGETEISNVCDETMDVSLNIKPTQGFELKVGKGVFTWCDGFITCKSANYELPLKDGWLNLRIIVDMGIAEFFGNDGEFYASMEIDFEGENSCMLTAIGDDIFLQTFTAHNFSLKSKEQFYG